MAYVKLLIMGLPGSGKTTLAARIAPKLRAVWFDGDVMRYNIWPELTFGNKDRIEASRRMGILCDNVNRAGHNAIASFICPTPETRAAFGATFTVWIDRFKEGRYADTNAIFVPPSNANLRLVTGSVSQWVDITMGEIDEAALYLGSAA